MAGFLLCSSSWLLPLLLHLLLLCRRAAAGAPEHSGSVGELLQQLLGMCGLLVTAAGAADTMQQQLKRDIFNEVSRAETAGPGWLAAAGPCAAWSQLAEVSSSLPD